MKPDDEFAAKMEINNVDSFGSYISKRLSRVNMNFNYYHPFEKVPNRIVDLELNIIRS
jgi:hypothetical protein